MFCFLPFLLLTALPADGPAVGNVNDTFDKEMLLIFMKLLQQGAIKPHFSVHDMIEYMIRQEREAYMERSCQMNGTVDGSSCLMMEVKALIKLLDILREIEQELMEAKESLPTALFDP